MNPSKTPSVRFKGYEDEWEERKLGELVEQIIREVPKPNKPYYRMSVRSHAKGTFKQFVDNPENVAMDKLFVVKKDDLVVNITFAWEHAIAVVNEENDGLLVSHRFPTYRADGKSDIEFLHHVVSKENFRRKLEFISPGGAGRNRVLNKKDFLKLKMFVPKIEEQQKIGSFFKQLDNTIALHQRKLNLLNEQKKGFLQKMFPKNGEKIPEIRFAGFNDDWEERKFADFIDVKSGKDYKHLNSGSIPVYGTGGYMLSVDRALSDIDAIGIGRKGTIDKPYLLKAPFWTVDTLFYAVPKQNIDLQFSLSIFKKINWKKFDESTGVPSLSKTVINSVSVSVPSYEEQQKIGSFFKQLDDTIALHQRKIDELKSMKKSMLQKMFV